MSKVDIYNLIKTGNPDYTLDKLPDVTEDLLDLFFFMYSAKEVSDYENLSDFYKDNDRLILGEVYV